MKIYIRIGMNFYKSSGKYRYNYNNLDGTTFEYKR